MVLEDVRQDTEDVSDEHDESEVTETLREGGDSVEGDDYLRGEQFVLEQHNFSENLNRIVDLRVDPSVDFYDAVRVRQIAAWLLLIFPLLVLLHIEELLSLHCDEAHQHANRQ